MHCFQVLWDSMAWIRWKPRSACGLVEVEELKSLYPTRTETSKIDFFAVNDPSITSVWHLATFLELLVEEFLGLKVEHQSFWQGYIGKLGTCLSISTKLSTNIHLLVEVTPFSCFERIPWSRILGGLVRLLGPACILEFRFSKMYMYIYIEL